MSHHAQLLLAFGLGSLVHPVIAIAGWLIWTHDANRKTAH